MIKRHVRVLREAVAANGVRVAGLIGDVLLSFGHDSKLSEAEIGEFIERF